MNETIASSRAFAGADISVEISRDTIDPQGLGSDEEFEACGEHILDAVRTAFPGAEVREVSHGGRTSGVLANGEDITSEVRAVMTAAFDSFEWSGAGETSDAEAVECAYCGATHTPGAIPALDDDAAWEALAEDHDDHCEWILTRAHRLDARVQADQEYGPDAWWDAARESAPAQTPAVAALFERIDEGSADGAAVYCRAQDAEALVAWASTLPAWDDGPAHAPHPLLVQPA